MSPLTKTSTMVFVFERFPYSQSYKTYSRGLKTVQKVGKLFVVGCREENTCVI